MTNIAISNLAWNKQEDVAVLELISNLKINCVEISPFRDDSDLSCAEKLAQQYSLHKIEIVALQSLLFRHSDLHLFQGELLRKRLFNHLLKVIGVAHKIKAKTIIFGGPKNKTLGNLEYKDAFEIAVTFFSQLAKHAESLGVIVCIEPTPAIYKTDFICNTKEAIDLVKKCNNKALRINFDMGAAIENKEDIENIILENAEYIGHIHISEPYLKKINLDTLFHKKIAKAIHDSGYNDVISIEMLRQDFKNIECIGETLSFIKNIYEC